jgi:hypothetical protein
MFPKIFIIIIFGEFTSGKQLLENNSVNGNRGTTNKRIPKQFNKSLVSFIGDFFSFVQYNLSELEKKENFNPKNKKIEKNQKGF